MENPQEVSSKALTVIEQANLIIITDQNSYINAGNLWKIIKELKDEVMATFSPIIAKAHAAHKEAIAQKDKVFNPLDTAGRKLKTAMEKFDAEQEQIRRAEQERLAEIARKQEEERRLAEAIVLEESMKAAGATKEETAQASQVILDEPVYVPPVVIPKAVPKVQGGPVYRTIWKFEIVNPTIIPREYLTVDEKKIGGIVRAMQGACKIPGVRVYQERV